MWLREPSEPGDATLKLESVVPSPQLMSTAQGLSAPGSVKEPRSKLAELPSSLAWLAGAVTVGATFVTLTVSVYSLVPPSWSRMRAATEREPLSRVGQLAVAVPEKAP